MYREKNTYSDSHSSAGFTFIELLVTMTIVGLILAAMVSAFSSQDRIHKAQDQVALMQQNLRAVMYMMAREIRMAGHDSIRSDGDDFGIEDIRFRDSSNDPDNGLTYSSITFSADDYDGSGSTTIRYVIYDDPTDDIANTMFLARLIDSSSTAADDDVIDEFPFDDDDADDDANNYIMAENIEAFCIAYAYDDDGDGELDDTAGGNIIWAIDSNNDNALDLNLDADDDGDIEADDIVDGGSALTSPVDPGRIRAVRIWLLGKVESPDGGYTDNKAYVVGNRLVQANDHHRRRLMETIVKCRNMMD